MVVVLSFAMTNIAQAMPTGRQAAPVSIKQDCLRPQALNRLGLLVAFEELVPVREQICTLTGKGIIEVEETLTELLLGNPIAQDLVNSLVFITQRMQINDPGNVLAALDTRSAIYLLLAISIDARQAMATSVSINPIADVATVMKSLEHARTEKGINFSELNSRKPIPEAVSAILTRDRLITYKIQAQDGSTLEVDISKALASRVGEMHGVSPQDLADISSKLERIRAEIDAAKQSGGNLEFLTSPLTVVTEEQVAIEGMARDLNERFEDIIIINGESIGAKAAFSALTDPLRNQIAFKAERGGARIHFLDSADEEHITSLLGALKALNGRRADTTTAIVVINDTSSKDPVTTAAYETVKAQFPQSETVTIDTPAPGIRSFFSSAGLLPLALAGINIKAVTDGGGSITQNPATATASPRDTLQNFAYLCPAIYYLLSKPKEDASRETHVKNLIALMIYSEMGQELAGLFADTFNTALDGSPVTADAAVGTKYQHFNLQAFQKAHSFFLIHTLGIRAFDNDMKIGKSADPHYAGLPMSTMLDACRHGVREAMQAGNRPTIDTTLEKLNPFGVGMLIATTQLESVVLGHLFNSHSEAKQHEQDQRLARLDAEAAQIAEKGIQKEEGVIGDMTTPAGIRINCDGVLEGKIGEKDGVTLEELDKRLVHLLRVQQAIQKEGNVEHPWLGVPSEMAKELTELEHQAQNFTEGYDDIVVVGVGGSSAGSKAGMDMLVDRFFNLLPEARRRGCPRIHFLGDNIDPTQASHTLKHLDPAKTGVLVISKSGITAESNIMFATIRANFEGRGLENFADHVCAITDKIDGILIKEAMNEGYRVVAHPEVVGGRWTLFTAVSAFLFAMQDIDLEKFYSSAEKFIDVCYGMNEEELEAVAKELEAALDAEDETRVIAARAKALNMVKRNPALLYGGLSGLLNEEKGRDLSVFLLFPEKLRGFREWLIQLYNESLGKPGVRLFTIGIQGLGKIRASICKFANMQRCMYTIITTPSEGKLDISWAQAILQKLARRKQPAFNIDLPALDEQRFAELALLFFGSVVVESRCFLKAKEVNPYSQLGVVEAKQRTLKLLDQEARALRRAKSSESRKESIIDLGSVVPGIDGELQDVMEGMVTHLWPAIADEIGFGGVGRPDLREKKLANIIAQDLNTDNYPQLHSIWLRNAANPKVLNTNGRFTVTATPIDNSESIEMANVTVGSLFAIYEGEITPENLVASFFLLAGPGLNFVGYVQGEQAGKPITCVYDFKLSEEGRLEPRINPARPDTEAWVEMKYRGGRSALHGRECDWMPAFRDFKKQIWDKRPLAVRYSNSMADVYEILLNGGLWMEALTPLEAMQLGKIFESAGGYGRSLVMTENGPVSAASLDLNNYEQCFNPEQQVWAFFGSKEIMEILEAYLAILGSGLDLNDFISSLVNALSDSMVQENPALVNSLLMLGHKLQLSLNCSQDKETTAPATQRLSGALKSGPNQEFVDEKIAALKKAVISNVAGDTGSSTTADEILNRLDLDTYVLLGSPVIVDRLRYELGVRSSVTERVIVALAERFSAISTTQLFDELKTEHTSIEALHMVFQHITTLREFYKTNTAEVHNMGWRKPPTSEAREINLRSSEGEATLRDALADIARNDDRLAADCSKIIADLLKVTVGRAIPAFRGEEIGYLMGETNRTGDEVADLDEVFNRIMLPALFATGLVKEIVSEEERHIITSFTDQEGRIYEGNPTSRIRIYIDPLDGSSKVATNGTVGMIMGIEVDGKIIASIFVLFGGQKSVILASEFTDEVLEYRLAEDGEFVKVAPFAIPSCRGKDRFGLALGGRRSRWAPKELEEYVAYLEAVMGGYSTYTGSYVSDVLRTIIYGGFYMYPGSNTGIDKGRLRPYETRPVGYIIQRAGGALSTGFISNLLIALDPHLSKFPHQIEPIIIGSKDAVEEFEAYILNKTAQQLLESMPAGADFKEHTGTLKRGKDQLHLEERKVLVTKMQELMRFTAKRQKSPDREILETAAAQHNLILPIHMADDTSLDDEMLDNLALRIERDEILMYPESGKIRLIVNAANPQAVEAAAAEAAYFLRYGFRGSLIAKNQEDLFVRVGDQVEENSARLIASDGLAATGKTTLVSGDEGLGIEGLRKYLEERFKRPVVVFSKDHFLKDRATRSAILQGLGPEEVYSMEADEFYDNERYNKILAEIRAFLYDDGPADEILQLSGPVYNRETGDIDLTFEKLLEDGAIEPISRDAIVIVEGDYVLAKSEAGILDLSLFMDVTNGDIAIKRAIDRELRKPTDKQQAHEDIRRRMQKIDIPTMRALQERSGFMAHVDFLVMHDHMGRPFTYENIRTAPVKEPAEFLKFDPHEVVPKEDDEQPQPARGTSVGAGAARTITLDRQISQAA